MKIAEIRDLTTGELKERIEVEVRAYEQKKINHSISPLDSPATITRSRREIARMRTELRQRELITK
ncbi:MAG: 50S ribosomal protein L29 [Dysgonamonadaceae bacterium]|jgi:large subunit ribosomal protein L29|nr:50S ribosomal protein L29 [Dysgonamonadaceae bacterium]